MKVDHLSVSACSAKTNEPSSVTTKPTVFFRLWMASEVPLTLEPLLTAEGFKALAAAAIEENVAYSSY